MFQKEEKPPEFIELKEDKRMKKLVTIVLVIALLSTMLALPAAASEVEPRARMTDCAICGTPCPVRERRVGEPSDPIAEPNCEKTHTAAVHHHVYTDYEEYLHCETCGDFTMVTYTKVFCQGVHIWTVNRNEVWEQ